MSWDEGGGEGEEDEKVACVVIGSESAEDEEELSDRWTESLRPERRRESPIRIELGNHF